MKITKTSSRPDASVTKLLDLLKLTEIKLTEVLASREIDSTQRPFFDVRSIRDVLRIGINQAEANHAQQTDKTPSAEALKAATAILLDPNLGNDPMNDTRTIALIIDEFTARSDGAIFAHGPEALGDGAIFAHGPEALGDRAMTAFRFEKAAQYYSSAAMQCGGHSKAERLKWKAIRAAEAHAAPKLYDALLMALPYVENCIHDKTYKAGAIAKMVHQMRSAIETTDAAAKGAL